MNRKALRRPGHPGPATTQPNKHEGRSRRRPTHVGRAEAARLVARWSPSPDGRLACAWTLEPNRGPAVRTITSEEAMPDADDGRSPRTGAPHRAELTALM
jgi:hypothetical protein